MKILLQKINIISPGSAHHLTEKDILIEDEKIYSIANPGSIPAGNTEVIDGKGLYVSPGWFDLHVHFGEPGEEYKEDIDSGCRAAIQGGFTGVLAMPSTQPPVSGRPAVEYILLRSKKYLVDVHVAGTISDQLEGKDLSEMYDMYLAGTRVFTDDKRAVQDAGLMTRALLYVQNFGGKIFSFPEDTYLAGKGQVHEGVIATALGLKGIPSIAEEIMINRDLLLADYTNSGLHFSTVSSRQSVETIRKAKSKGMKITADVAASHLLLDDSFLNGFDTLYKLKPPLRTPDDRKALIGGLIDGTIDCICSDHLPQNAENKIKEFELASFGAAGLETAFAVARTATLNKLSLPELIAKFTSHPRLCAGLNAGLIEVNCTADLTIFNPDLKWKVTEDHIFSKSLNNPFMNRELTGKAVAVINKGQIEYCK
jgi:dihydroorotase